MINNVTLVGRLAKDPEIKFTASGIAYSRFTLAVNRPFKSNDERKADFISCIAWRKQAENLANFMRKGGLIGITGRIQTDSYQDADGKRVYTTDVIAEAIQFLERKNSGADNENAPYRSKSEHQQPNYYQQRPPQQQEPSFSTPAPQTGQQWSTNLNNSINPSGTSVDITEDELPF